MVQGLTTGLAHREVVYLFVALGFCARSLAEKAQALSEEAEAAPVEEGALDPVV